MSIGYACLTQGVADTGFKSCIIKNASDEKLLELIEYNLDSLDRIIDYNISNNILLFRISSDIIPFGSNSVNTLKWENIFRQKLLRIGYKIQQSGMRVSMHPGQYTVLNSPDPKIAQNAAADLLYHARFLDSLDTSVSCKIILHIGGVYGDKNIASERFIENYNRLQQQIKDRLVIENDDKLYNIEDVLKISRQVSIPVVFDNLHHFINPPPGDQSEDYWISEANKTWSEIDGLQKIHYSQQAPDKRKGSHTKTIHVSEFLNFFENLPDKKIDIMLEVKDKNLSAIKCINVTAKDNDIIRLEKEWAKYKYLILEHSQQDYNIIRQMLKDKTGYPSELFYNKIDSSLEKDIEYGNAVNAASHVWGYFKDCCTDKEKKDYEKKLETYLTKKTSLKILKAHLYKMAQKYKCDYLLDSYYFYM